MTEEEKEVGIQDIRKLLKEAKEDHNKAHPDQKIYKVSLELWSATQDILDVLSGDDEKYEKVIGCRIELAKRKNQYSRLIVEYQRRPIDKLYHKPGVQFISYGLNVRLLGD